MPKPFTSFVVSELELFKFFIYDPVFSLFEMLFAIIYKATLKLFLFRIGSFIGYQYHLDEVEM